MAGARFSSAARQPTFAANKAGPTGAHRLITRPVSARPRASAVCVAALLARRPLRVPLHHHHRTGRRCATPPRLADLPNCYAAIFVSLSAAEMTLAPDGACRIKLPVDLRVAAFDRNRRGTEARRCRGQLRFPESALTARGPLALPFLQAAAVNGKVRSFAATTAREMLREALTARGATVSAVTAYHRRAPTRHRLVCSNCCAVAKAASLNAIPRR